MNKKLIWIVVAIILVAGAAYAGYMWNSKETAKTVEGLLNQSQARRIDKCVGKEVGASNNCPGGTTSAGGYSFCWGAGGLSISCYE